MANDKPPQEPPVTDLPLPEDTKTPPKVTPPGLPSEPPPKIPTPQP